MGLTEDSEHNIWVETHGSPATLVRIQDLRVREEFPEPPIPLARKLAPDPQNGIWMGLVNGNLARFRSGKTEIFTFADHPITRVQALFAASDGSILGATEFGVVGWKNGKQQILSVHNGLPCGDINAVISDDQGDLWLYAACGLIEIPKDEVQRWWEEPEVKLRARVFDALDGVQSGVSHFNSSSKAPDGRLWFANASVVQTVDPAHMTGNTVPPPLHLNGIVADRKSYPPQEAVKLPALTHDLEIDYTATSFAAPKKVRFRYMLEGHDAGWQEPGTRRQAFTMIYVQAADKIRRVMNLVFKHGQTYGLIPRTEEANPMKFVRVKTQSEYEAKIITPDQCFKILMLMPQPERTLTLLIAATGLRISECLGLQWLDVDDDSQQIFVRRSWTGGKIGKPKTASSKAPVPMVPLLAGFIRQWQEQTPYGQSTDWVLPARGSRVSVPVSPTYLSKIISVQLR